VLHDGSKLFDFGGFTCANFTPEEHEILRSNMGELGMKGCKKCRATELHQLIHPDLNPADYEELVARKGADVLLEELWMKRCVRK
jgi:hypothetical protein